MAEQEQELAALHDQVGRLTESVARLERLLMAVLLRPPVYVEAQELNVERLAFLIPGISAESIQGPLSIGLTQQVSIGGDGAQAGPWVAGVSERPTDGAANTPAAAQNLEPEIPLWPGGGVAS